jgi:hypothetical protein
MESRSDLGPDEPGSFAAIPRSILDAKSSICRCAHTPADQTMLDFSAQAVLRKNNLSKRRQVTGDLHFFKKEPFPQGLRDEEHEILDWFYMPRSLHRASGMTRKILQLPQVICFELHSDFAVRLLGGYSLFVLAK